MSDYYVCSDNIDGNENSRIEALCEALKKNGHNATNGGVGSNTVQSHGQTSAANGQIGVFICGGVDIQVFWDFVQGIGTYYNYKRFIYVYASDTATTDKWLTCNGAKNTPTVQAHDDNYSGGQGDAIGKTVDAYCNEHKDKIWYACGPLGCSFDDVIENFLKGEGGGDENNSSSDTSSSSSIKSCIQELLYPWNGEAYCFLRDDTIHIGRIPGPTNTLLVLAEGDNVNHDSISVTDINPNTPNKLIITAGDTEYVIEDKERIKRFGEKKETVECNIQSETDIVDFAYREWNKLLKDSGRVLECSVTGDPKWRIGKWVRVYMPSFELDGFMWITKCSHDDDGEWETNLTLKDYPPDLGVEPSSSNNNDNSSGS